MPDPALPLNDLPRTGVGLVVVLLLVGSTISEKTCRHSSSVTAVV